MAAPPQSQIPIPKHHGRITVPSLLRIIHLPALFEIGYLAAAFSFRKMLELSAAASAPGPGSEMILRKTARTRCICSRNAAAKFSLEEKPRLRASPVGKAC